MHPKVKSVYDGLEESLTQLEAMAAEYDVDKLNHSPEKGKWSAIQHMEHLVLVEVGVLAYMRKKIPHLDASNKTGLKSKLKFLAMKMFFLSGGKAKAPKITATVPDRAELADTMSKWRKTRADWKTFMRDLPEETMELSVFRHPYAGPLNFYQTVEFLQAHFDHHLRAIKKCLR